jgi:septum formation protein
MKRIILASGSPRRRDLLTQMGVSFDVVPSDFDEQLDDSRTTEEVAVELGLGKALTVAQNHPNAVVIGSDTIVTLDGKQLGKPTDRADAERLLRAHAGRTVTVTSSVAVVCVSAKVRETATDTATVVFKPSIDDVLQPYLDSNDWQDKAGGWGIQSGAAVFIDHMRGSYDTVLGLPTTLLAAMLAQFGITARGLDLEPPVKRLAGK